MSVIHQSRNGVLGIVVVASALLAPIAVSAEDQLPVLAPIAAPSWGETSGYNAVEASRAMIGHASWEVTSGYSSVEATRATIGHPPASTAAEDALTTLVAAVLTWDTRSGYGAVEASRAER
jgi:hypothetical protein